MMSSILNPLKINHPAGTLLRSERAKISRTPPPRTALKTVRISNPPKRCSRAIVIWNNQCTLVHRRCESMLKGSNPRILLCSSIHSPAARCENRSKLQTHVNVAATAARTRTTTAIVDQRPLEWAFGEGDLAGTLSTMCGM